MTTTRRTLIAGAAAGAAAMPLIRPGAQAATASVTDLLPEGALGADAAKGLPMPGGVRLPETPPSPGSSDSIGIAVVGLGGYALNQMLPAMSQAKGCHVAAVVSGNPEKAARIAAAYGVPADAIYSYETFDQIAGDDRIDAVNIVLPTGLHTVFTLKAFAAGKHVLCEKPMALTVAECDAMMAAAKAADRRLMIAYRCHFEPYNLKAMELMREGAVGNLRLVRTANHYVSGPTTPQQNWRFNRAMTGGGPLEDYGLYGLQSALYLSGELPAEVYATTRQPEGDPRFTEIFSHVTAEFRFPSGAVAYISSSYDAAGENSTFVTGDEAVLRMEPATSYHGNTLTVGRGRSARSYEPGESGVQFAQMLDHFASAVRDGTEIIVPGEMGRRDTALIQTIYRSAAEDRPLPFKS